MDLLWLLQLLRHCECCGSGAPKETLSDRGAHMILGKQIFLRERQIVIDLSQCVYINARSNLKKDFFMHAVAGPAFDT